SYIVQGALAGAWATPRAGRWRGEVSGSGGVNSYVTSDSGFPAYGHALGRIRLHYGAPLAGAWVGGATGQTFFGKTGGTPVEVALGAWAVRDRFSGGATVTGTWLADTAYLDVVGSLRWVHPLFTASGSAGFRAWSKGGGSGVYGEGSIQVPFWKRLALMLAGGRYPSDPVRGVIAASYVSAGFRLTAFGASPDPRAALDAYRRQSEFSGGASPAHPRLELGDEAIGGRTLRIVVRGALSVEVAGDFTDWEPRELARSGGDVWTIRLPLQPGIHRLNVRIDGKTWVVPQGLRPEEDEYGGQVGILVIS
ncbi:MAG: glycogen-binding domain-containing protein, partial [Gemmatimonadales bacterium]|nr:glycogen-binding domain-containing protein [Gemmatimonadales bacterium]